MRSELDQLKSITKFMPEIKDELMVFISQDGELQAFSTVCPHMAGQVVLKEGELFCRWHGLKFDKHGTCTRFKGALKLRKYLVSEMDGEVFIL